LNPENPSSGVSTPETMKKAMIRIDVVSMLKYSLTNKKIAIAIIAMVI
jgi:hypothetical protein